jgi:hypothetical protein
MPVREKARLLKEKSVADKRIAELNRKRDGNENRRHSRRPLH